MADKNTKNPYLIAIAGPSGSGKSEVCKELQKEFGDVLCTSIDDYFRDPKELPRIGEWENTDVPEAIQFDSLAKDLEALKMGQEITVSVLKYPHQNWERTEKRIKPAQYVIIEGFLVLYDEKVRDICDLKIFIEVSENIEFERRMSRNPKENETYIRQVAIPNYRIYGIPTKQYADIIIDGSKPFAEVAQEVKKTIKDRRST